MTTLYLIRHGEVYNPQGIIYGRLPGFGLSERGRRQIASAAESLRSAPPTVLYASPMQRTQESAALLAQRWSLTVQTDERIVETSIGSFQGRRFEDLPKPYITEEGAHPELEGAASMRIRFMDWVEDVRSRHAGQVIAAVSHRDPIIVALLYWQQCSLEGLPDFAMDPGSVYEVAFSERVSVRALITAEEA